MSPFTTDPDKTAEALAESGEPIAQYFGWAHLPSHLAAVSQPFAQLAGAILTLPRNPERTTALRKLLEAKDCAVRAALTPVGGK